MLSNLAKQLISIPQREDAGADSASRYHYQALFGLSLIFKVHNSLDDYAVVFEFHDDIALIDNHHKPERISFYQVKTKAKSNWNLAALIQQKAGAITKGQPKKLPSILGKMYCNVVNFGEHLEATTFVSNAHMNFGPNSSDFALELCAQDQLQKANAQILSEHPNEKLVKTNLIRFSRSELNLDDSDTHAKGMLSNFVAKNLGEVEFSLDVLFRAIVSECTRKSRVKIAQSSFEEIVEKKGITKSKTIGWLETIKRTNEYPNWSSIAPDISYSHAEKIRLEREWKLYKVQALDADAALSIVRSEISRELEDLAYSSLSLMGTIDKAFPKVEAFAKERLGAISTERLKVMIIYETYAKI